MSKPIEDLARIACYRLWLTQRIKNQRLEGMLIRDPNDIGPDGSVWQWRWNHDDTWSSYHEVVYSDLVTTQCLLLLYREAIDGYASCVRVPGGYRMHHALFEPVWHVYESELECIVMNLVRVAEE